MNKVFGVFLFGVAALGTTALGMERGPEHEGEQGSLEPAAVSAASSQDTGAEATWHFAVAPEIPQYEHIAKLLESPGGKPFSMEELLAPLTIQTRAVLSPKDAYWLGRVWGALAVRIHTDVPLQTARTIESLSYAVDNTNPIPTIDMDRLLFSRACFPGEIAIILAAEAKDRSMRLDVFEYCDRACRGFDQYIAFNKKGWGSLLCPKTLAQFETHRYLAHEKRARISLARYVVCRQERSLRDRLEDVTFTIGNTREALAQPLPAAELIPAKRKLFLSLVQSYCHQAVLCEEGADRAGFEGSLQLAKNNLKELAKNKKKDEESYKNAQAHIEACEEQKRILDAANRGGKGKIAERRRLNALNLFETVQGPLLQLIPETSKSEGGVALPAPLSSPRDLREEREAVLQKVLSGDPTPFSKLYALKGVSAKVEREIETQTWKFTREEFGTYLKTVGCLESRMRGSHKTISLPTMVCITQGDNVVMVLTQDGDASLDFESTPTGSPAKQQAFGGSSTLPPWKGKIVPAYMRVQILKARERLRGFALLAQKNPPAVSRNPG